VRELRSASTTRQDATTTLCNCTAGPSSTFVCFLSRIALRLSGGCRPYCSAAVHSLFYFANSRGRDSGPLINFSLRPLLDLPEFRPGTETKREPGYCGLDLIHSFILETYIAPLQETTTQRRNI